MFTDGPPKSMITPHLLWTALTELSLIVLEKTQRSGPRMIEKCPFFQQKQRWLSKLWDILLNHHFADSLMSDICSKLLLQSVLWLSWKRHTDHNWRNKVSLLLQKENVSIIPKKLRLCAVNKYFLDLKNAQFLTLCQLIASLPVWSPVDYEGAF